MLQRFFVFFNVQLMFFFVYAGAILFARPAIEDPCFYVKNYGVQSFFKLFENYWRLAPGEPFYRPSQYYLPYYLIYKVFSPHNVLAIKCIHVFLYGVVAYLFLKIAELFIQSRVLSFFALAWWITHTTNFFPVNSVTAFDSIYQIFSLAFVLSYWDFLNSNRVNSYIKAILFFAISLTSKENSLANAGMLLLMHVLHFYWPARAETPLNLKAILKKIGPFFLILIGYFIIYLPLLRTGNGGGPTGHEYRTHWDTQIIWSNLKNFSFWITKLKQPTYLNAYNFKMGAWYYLLGMLPFVAATASILVFWRRQNLALLVFFGLWTFGYAVIPVYSGGFPWHASLSNLGFGLFIGAALKPFFDGKILEKVTKPIFIALGCMTILSGCYHFYHFSKNDIEGEARANALAYPPIPASSLSGDEFFLVDVETQPGFGVGCLFKWVYLKPEIKEAHLQGASVEVLKQWLDAPRKYCLKPNPEASRFVDDTEACKAKVIKKISGLN